MSKKSWPPETRETTNYFKLPTWADDNHVHTVVETPRGSRVMVEFDPKLGEVPGRGPAKAIKTIKKTSL